jgi:transcriptional regulator with XRE-family HTH domain
MNGEGESGIIPRPVPEPSTLAQRIRKRLTATGLAMMAASKRAGLNETYVRDLLAGTVKSPRMDSLEKLAAALETTVDWLAYGRGEEEPSAEQLAFDRLRGLLARIAPEDLPQAERALKGFVRDDQQREFEADKPRPPRRPKRR